MVRAIIFWFWTLVSIIFIGNFLYLGVPAALATMQSGENFRLLGLIAFVPIAISVVWGWVYLKTWPLRNAPADE